ncbi:MAG: radical SAM protein [Candidatus Pacearchaeota archaeon]|jgi:MoaA/NifB/PqqE/SkfB family radical SAM enzyme
MEKKTIPWEINNVCNFKCPYCNWIEDNKNIKPYDKNNLEKVMKFFNSLDESIITISGGEPFLYPNFIELIEKLSKKHLISIFTNLSSEKIEEFSKKIPIKRVSNIRASMHLTELNHLNYKKRFIENFKILKNKGFNINASVVMWPPIFPKFKKIYNEFAKENIFLIPVSFQGEFNKKTYPDSYSKKELDIIKRYWFLTNKKIGIRVEDPSADISTGEVSFIGELCNTGMNRIVIRKDGTITRCWSDKKIIGNIFNEDNIVLDKFPSECKCKTCLCPWEGYNYCLSKPKIIKNNKKIKNIKKNKSTINKIIEEILN